LRVSSPAEGLSRRNQILFMSVLEIVAAARRDFVKQGLLKNDITLLRSVLAEVYEQEAMPPVMS
jgi:hypothetical protein